MSVQTEETGVGGRAELYGVRIVYSQQQYTAEGISVELQRLFTTWTICYALSLFRETLEVGTDSRLPHQRFNVAVDRVLLPRFRYAAGTGPEIWPRQPALLVNRMRLASPLDLTLAIEAAGGSAITIYAVHLFAKLLKDPEQLGSFIPKVLFGWYESMIDLHKIRDDYRARGRAMPAGMEPYQSEGLEDAITHRARGGLTRPEFVETIGVPDIRPSDPDPVAELPKGFLARLEDGPTARPQTPPRPGTRRPRQIDPDDTDM